MTAPVKWLGHSAVYAEPERAILAALPVREQAFLHTLKAFMEGELSNSDSPAQVGEGAVEKARPGCVSAVKVRPPSPVYTDPEDIPFGAGVQTPRKLTYALCWTWRKHKVFPSKSSKFPWKSAEHKQRVWKKWYERQGWKVSSHATGYFARHPLGQSHSISLHEYDSLTKERLR